MSIDADCCDMRSVSIPLLDLVRDLLVFLLVVSCEAKERLDVSDDSRIETLGSGNKKLALTAKILKLDISISFLLIQLTPAC